MRFHNYLTEEVKYISDTKESIDIITSLMKNNPKLFKLPVIWRGWLTKTLFYCADVSGADQREMMRGMTGLPDKWKSGTMRDWVKDVVKGLGFVPVCCSYSYNQASFFGNPCVVIPEAGFKMYQNPEVSDIKVVNPGSTSTNGVHMTTYDYTDEQLQKILDGYKEDYSDNNKEILLKCGSYYLVNASRMLWVTRNSKYNKIKEAKDIHTYQQLLDVVYNFKSYMKWIEERRPK